jgi:hypothetical protein
MRQFHLAQVNIARMRAPLESPLLVDFVSRLAEINALADQSEGAPPDPRGRCHVSAGV